MKKATSDYIHELIPESLDTVPFHSQVNWVERLVACNLPLHLAVHKIRDAKAIPLDYVELHNHSYPEINIILGDDDTFLFKVQLGDDVYHVNSSSSIWIPAGMDHSIVAVSGSGYYVCLILKGDAGLTYESLTGKP